MAVLQRAKVLHKVRACAEGRSTPCHPSRAPQSAPQSESLTHSRVGTILTCNLHRVKIPTLASCKTVWTASPIANAQIVKCHRLQQRVNTAPPSLLVVAATTLRRRYGFALQVEMQVQPEKS